MQAGLLIAEGACIYIFAKMGHLLTSVAMLIVFSIFMQAAQGSTYGIVSYVNKASQGAVAGIVGAGGSTGGVCFGIIFRQLPNDPEIAFCIMAGAVVVSSAMSVFINIKDHSGILFGEEAKETVRIQIPVLGDNAGKDADIVDEGV